MEGIVLQKALADAGIASRRKAETYIIDGRVSVNGTVVTKLGTRVHTSDTIAVDGEEIGQEEHVYFLLHKPQDVLSASSDDRERKTVIDLIETDKRIVPVGRLDKDTTGLLVLTNDGDLVHKMTHPKHEHEKEYEAVITTPREWQYSHFETALERMSKGVLIEEGIYSLPAYIEVIKKIAQNKYRLRITIHEGRKHQIKRMISGCGMSVHALKRVRSGMLTLGSLATGQYRELTKKEVSQLKKESIM